MTHQHDFRYNPTTLRMACCNCGVLMGENESALCPKGKVK